VHREVRSETFRTVTPSSALSASLTRAACSSSVVLQVTSTTRVSWWDSVTSRAVIAAPAAPTAAASSLVAVKLEGASTRRVIEFPGLGFAIEFSS